MKRDLMSICASLARLYCDGINPESLVGLDPSCQGPLRAYRTPRFKVSLRETFQSSWKYVSKSFILPRLVPQPPSGFPPTTPVASEYCVIRPRYMSASPLPVVLAPVPLNVYVPWGALPPLYP